MTFRFIHFFQRRQLRNVFLAPPVSAQPLLITHEDRIHSVSFLGTFSIAKLRSFRIFFKTGLTLSSHKKKTANPAMLMHIIEIASMNPKPINSCESPRLCWHRHEILTQKSNQNRRCESEGHEDAQAVERFSIKNTSSRLD